MRREAKFQTQFRHWIHANPRMSAAFELKQTATSSIPFNAVEEHQINALLAVQRKGLLYKAPDDSIGIKPFDFFYLRNTPAYVVIKYPSFFCLIDVDIWVNEAECSNRKSLTAEKALQIAELIVK